MNPEVMMVLIGTGFMIGTVVLLSLISEVWRTRR